MLSTYDFILGTSELGAVFLSIIAGIIAISLFQQSRKKELLRSWKYLIIALVLFAIEEVVGALKSFGIYSTPHLTHVIPSFILAFLIAAIVIQINIYKGEAR